MGENLRYAKIFTQFPFALRRFMKKKITLEDAKRIVSLSDGASPRKFSQNARTECLMAIPRSPYLKLLNHAGCELGDVRSLVNQNGVDGTLQKLRQEDVYVTFEEFKGRKPITRNGLTFTASPFDFDNPHAADGPAQPDHRLDGRSGQGRD